MTPPKANVTLTLEGVDPQRVIDALQLLMKPRVTASIKFGPVSEQPAAEGTKA